MLDILTNLSGLKDDISEKIDIFSFNYTLDVRFLDWLYNSSYNNHHQFKINSWTNVHGICSATDVNSKNYIIKVAKDFFNQNIDYSESFPKVIFGIDNEVLNVSDNQVNTNNSLRFFTKGFRNSADNTNIIKCGQPLDKYDKLTIIGHSLNTADYSYFKGFLEKAIKNNSEIEYYYYKSSDKATDRLQTLINRYGNEIKYKGNLYNDLYNNRRIILKQTPSI